MVEGTLRAMQSRNLTRDAVTDLTPARPVAADGKAIREMYRTNLTVLYCKLTGRTYPVPTLLETRTFMEWWGAQCFK